MDHALARSLIELNNRFYEEHAASFSATRTTPWNGWQAVAELVREHGRPIRTVLDLACGNLRFERFLARELPDSRRSIHVIDSCPALVCSNGDSCGPSPSAIDLTYHQADILAALLDASPLDASTVSTPRQHAHEALPATPACDLAVCFGFMHHVPTFELRAQVLTALIDHTAPGGLAIVSFWQFMHDPRLAAKVATSDALAQENGLRATAHERPVSLKNADLEPGDHFLGWQADPAPLRYCHHCSAREIDALVAFVGERAREVARWVADGSSGTLNQYIALERL